MGVAFSYRLPNVRVENAWSCTGGTGGCGWVKKIIVTEVQKYYDIEAVKHSSKHRFAIVKLRKPAVVNTNIGPLCLPEDPSRDSYSEQGIVFGFGYRKDFRNTAAAEKVYKLKQRTIVKQSFDSIDVTKTCRNNFGSFALESVFKRTGWAGWMEM